MPTLDDLIHIARAAGSLAMNMRGAMVHTKNDGTVVTDADLEVNNLILTSLERFSIPVLSEESEPPPQSAMQFIVDPIDGTVEFIEGTSEWCVMIGLCDERPLMGVVYVPAQDALYAAERGKGAFALRGGERTVLSVSQTSSLVGATLLTSVHRPSPLREMLKEKGMVAVPRGSSGVKLSIIAAGEAEAYVTGAPLAPWDLCAAAIIVEEAGGKVTDLSGTPLSCRERLTNGLVVSNAHLHPILVELVRHGK